MPVFSPKISLFAFNIFFLLIAQKPNRNWTTQTMQTFNYFVLFWFVYGNSVTNDFYVLHSENDSLSVNLYIELFVGCRESVFFSFWEVVRPSGYYLTFTIILKNRESPLRRAVYIIVTNEKKNNETVNSVCTRSRFVHN